MQAMYDKMMEEVAETGGISNLQDINAESHNSNMEQISRINDIDESSRQAEFN